MKVNSLMDVHFSVGKIGSGNPPTASRRGPTEEVVGRIVSIEGIKCAVGTFKPYKSSSPVYSHS